MSKNLALGRLAFIVTGLLVGGAVAVWFDPLASEFSDYGFALRLSATVLSVLTGFLMALIVLLGDPKGLYGGGWKVASAHTRQISHLLGRLRLLFYSYLLAISLVFLAALAVTIVPQQTIFVSWIGRVALGLSSTVLFWSFGLPSVLYRTQIDRLNAVVEEREKEEIKERKKMRELYEVAELILTAHVNEVAMNIKGADERHKMGGDSQMSEEDMNGAVKNLKTWRDAIVSDLGLDG